MAVRRKTRDLERTRAEILAVTFREVFRNGFQGVSVDDIVQKTKLTKGALYHQFPNKMELGYALVDEVIRPMILERWITPLEKYENPLEGILVQMRDLIGRTDPALLKLGCPLNNLVQEMAPLDAGFRKRLRAGLEEWIEGTRKHLERAQRAGHIRPEIDVREVAQFVVMAHEGFYGMLKGIEDSKAFPSLFRALLVYFRGISIMKSGVPELFDKLLETR